MSKPIPKVGDTVVLNDHGLRQIFQHTLGLAHMKTLKMKITCRSAQSLTFPELTFSVSVDNPEINAYMIDHNCFDVVST
jgi:hypothetical protein